MIWLTRLDDLLRRASNERRFFSSWVLIAGVLFVALHSVSDIGIYALLAGKVASYAAQHDNGLAYTRAISMGGCNRRWARDDA